MYRFQDPLYLHITPFYEADGGAAGGGDGGQAAGRGDDHDVKSKDGDNGQEKPEEKKYTQRDVDEVVKKRLARERRKWQRETEKLKNAQNVDVSDLEALRQKAEAAEQKALVYERREMVRDKGVRGKMMEYVIFEVEKRVTDEFEFHEALQQFLQENPEFTEETAMRKSTTGMRHGSSGEKYGVSVAP
ncbi:hypothetical protein [Bianquea renquensis]|jgi:hypothetical protein|uniref:Uncharacterized protein n=1 Tax=Bianquea renquensis TaxID=2763661 RepID=A0A926I117_9FIRM|nr:hypothetical protein [Bianquea renquensis]MBC8542511.1 hypothetical protein [Bianquea renquensis]